MPAHCEMGETLKETFKVFRLKPQGDPERFPEEPQDYRFIEK